MREIAKGAEPPSLLVHRQTPQCDYENYSDKDSLRKALVTDQRGICCYCMGRIHAEFDAMKVEHWHCQDHYPGEQLDYANLLGACLGGQGQPPTLQHCDTKKANLSLKWNPSDSIHHIETRIRYDPDGTVTSDDPEFDAQLNKVLNLNLPFFKQNRKMVLDSVLEWWKMEKAKQQDRIPKTRVETKQKQFKEKIPLDPFSQVAVWWLQQKLEKRSK